MFEKITQFPERFPLNDVNQPPEILQAFLEYVKKKCGFLLLAGKNGTGKSFAAQKIMSEFNIHDSDYKMFTTQTELNLRWQAQIKQWGETTYLLNQITKTKILVLDDLGTRTPTEAFMDFLYAIIEIRHRSKDGLATIITTNLNSKDMREKFGDAFVSRVASGICFRLDGPDRRFKDF